METILSIAGKPGLFRLVSRGKQTLIVETLDEAKRRMPAFATDRVTSLGDIAMFTDSEDIPLWQVLKNVGEKEQSKPCSINFRKASGKELREYFAEPRFCPSLTATAYTTVTSRSCFSGTTSLSKTASLTSRKT